MTRPGALDERITFQSQTLASDGGGGSTKTWGNIAGTPTVWAAVKAQSGREVFESDRNNATSMTKFTIRNRSDIDETMRIVWRGKNYNIRDIPDVGFREMYLTIIAERGVSN